MLFHISGNVLSIDICTWKQIFSIKQWIFDFVHSNVQEKDFLREMNDFYVKSKIFPQDNQLILDFVQAKAHSNIFYFNSKTFPWNDQRWTIANFFVKVKMRLKNIHFLSVNFEFWKISNNKNKDVKNGG